MAKSKSGYIIAAAFIGPGTVTTASLAGASLGYHLVWALLFSIMATIVLQDMAARLGAASSQSLPQALQSVIRSSWKKHLLSLLIISAIGVGNAAYEAGNITGAAVGLSAFSSLSLSTWAMLIGGLAALLIATGIYRLIESVLVGLVGVMALVFITTFVFSSPDWGQLYSQALSPNFDAGNLTLILALIGTTIVPYNLFLHASLVANEAKQRSMSDVLAETRSQSARAISLGGLVTLVIMGTAMMTYFQTNITFNAATMSEQLKPILGDYAHYFFSLGLFCAGLTSAITAPMAAAYAVTGALGMSSDIRSGMFKFIALMIVGVGVAVAISGTKPLMAIVFAQATNGVLLPVIAIMLLWVMNRHPALGQYRNGVASNTLGAIVVISVTALAGYKLYSMV